MIRLLLLAVLLPACLWAGAASTGDSILALASPNGKLIFQSRLSSAKDWEYRLLQSGHIVLDWSPLGFTTLTGTTIPSAAHQLQRSKISVVNETFPWLFGENTVIKNTYKQFVLQIISGGAEDCRLQVRLYDKHIAFRYLINGLKPEQQKIITEKTGFTLTHGYTAYQHNTESVFTPVLTDVLVKASDLPLVLTDGKQFLSINEAANDHYTKVLIERGAKENTLVLRFPKDTVQTGTELISPWRTVSVTANENELADGSDLLYKLNPPAPLGKNYAWIQPGKLIRDMTLTTQGALDCIDFAHRMNFQYVMFDAGWYGKGYAAEFDKESDPHRVVAAIDMDKVITHGKEQEIGIILYVNYVGLRKHNLDSLFTLYKNWGVKGLKFGFVNGLTQSGISWLISAVRKAQDYGFIIDVHDNYKPTGISRTIPAWLTQEGVRGNENNPDAFHNTVLPFTRFLSGPADYTFCYRSQNDSFNHTILDKKLQVSKAHQLALTVIFYSPLQSMLWYGRPAYYQKPEEIEFFREVPTTWDQTLHLSGVIGKYVTVARKKSDRWFVGSAAAVAHTEKISLSFLDAGKKYTAVIYTDDGNGGIRRTVETVMKNDIMDGSIASACGQAVILSPAK